MRVPGSRSSCASRLKSKSRRSTRNRPRRFRMDSGYAVGLVVESLEARRLLSVVIPAVPTPAAHWTFDAGTGTIAADSSGNGHTGTLGAGVSWVAGNVGTGAISVSRHLDRSGYRDRACYQHRRQLHCLGMGGPRIRLRISDGRLDRRDQVAGFYLGLRATRGRSPSPACRPTRTVRPPSSRRRPFRSPAPGTTLSGSTTPARGRSLSMSMASRWAACLTRAAGRRRAIR